MDRKDSVCEAESALRRRAWAAYAASTAAWSSAWRRTAARREAGELGAEVVMVVADKKKKTQARKRSVISAANAARRGARDRPPAIGNANGVERRSEFASE